MSITSGKNSGGNFSFSLDGTPSIFPECTYMYKGNKNVHRKNSKKNIERQGDGIIS